MSIGRQHNSIQMFLRNNIYIYKRTCQFKRKKNVTKFIKLKAIGPQITYKILIKLTITQKKLNTDKSYYREERYTKKN